MPIPSDKGFLSIALLFFWAAQGDSGLGDNLPTSLVGGTEKVHGLRAREQAQTWFRKGLEAKELVEKERHYVEALRRWPGYPEAHNNLGDVYEKQERYSEALREYQITVSLAPSLAVAWLGLGDVQFLLGHYEASIQAYQRGLPLEPDRSAQRRLGLAQILISTIHFSFDSSHVTQTARRQLQALAETLQEPELRAAVFEVEGHADSVGLAGYNHQLSLARARRVRRFLVRQGIDPTRLVVMAYGEDRPLASSQTPEKRARNRRVQLIRKIQRETRKSNLSPIPSGLPH